MHRRAQGGLERARSQPPLVRALLLVTVGLTAAYAMSVLPGVRDGASELWEIWVISAVWVTSTAVCLLRAVHVSRDRLAWWAMTLALGLSSAGFIGDAVAFSGTDPDSQPWVSLADVAWLGYYPLAYVALVLLVRSRARDLAANTWLDGLVSGLAAAAVVATIVLDGFGGLGTPSGEGATSTGELLLAAAYPAADVLLVLLVVALFAVTGWRPGKTWLLLGAGLLVQVLADIIYLFQVAAGSYAEATWLDSLWLGTPALTAWAAWASRPTRLTVVADWRTLSTPAVSVVIATCVLGTQAWTGDRATSVVLAVAAILVGTCRAALVRARALADSQREAQTDELTGLPNRRWLFTVIEQHIGRGEPFAVLLLDLDGFKEINDTLGHGTGDVLLTQVGRRLDERRRTTDVLARLGGDEFALVAVGAGDADGAARAAGHIASALSEPFRLGPVTVTVEVSAGVALFPAHADTVSDLLARADAAMYQAKRDRSEHALYDPDRHDHSVNRLGVVAALRAGLDRGELVVHFQPQVDIRTGSLVGLEALARWQHPERGLLGPHEFLPGVEHTNAMRPFTEVMLRTVLSQQARWRGSSLHVPVSVNVSAPNLVDAGFAETVGRLLVEHGVSPRELVVEVTENAVLTDAERALGVLHDLRSLGVGLSIDDFGTGLSSLQRLRMLPVDELKIDKTFVAGLPDDVRDTAVVEASITLARRMKLQVIAEGVETERARQALLRLGCDRAQGFLFAGPLAVENLEAWVGARSGVAETHPTPEPVVARALDAVRGLADA